MDASQYTNTMATASHKTTRVEGIAKTQAKEFGTRTSETTKELASVLPKKRPATNPRTQKAHHTSSAAPQWSAEEKKRMWLDYLADTPSFKVTFPSYTEETQDTLTVNTTEQSDSNQPDTIKRKPNMTWKEAESAIGHDTCIRCSTATTIGDDGFPYCPNCGVINTSLLDHSPEWRFFSADDRRGADPSRCGNPIDPLLEQSSLAAKVLCGPNASSEMKNLRTWISWQAMPANEKALYDEFQIIQTLSFAGGLSKGIVDSAKVYYKEFYERQTHRGLNRDATRVGAVWLACWKHNCPRSANELAEIFKVEKSTASLGCTGAEELLKSTERTLSDVDKSQFSPICPSSFIERFCSKLNFPTHLITLALFVSKRVETHELIPDNRPQAIAVGILYFISHHFQLGHSKVAIKTALASEVSEVTINKCFVKLDAHINQLIPPSMMKHIGTSVVGEKQTKKSTAENTRKREKDGNKEKGKKKSIPNTCSGISSGIIDIHGIELADDFNLL